MNKIEKFEDIEAWQSAQLLTGQIYAVTNQGEFARDFGLRDQIRRAAVSIMSNIAESFGREGNREFAQFLSTAKGRLRKSNPSSTSRSTPITSTRPHSNLFTTKPRTPPG